MTPTARFHALVASSTVFAMFWLLGYAVPLLKSAAPTVVFVSSLAAFFSAVGIYRLLAKAVEWLLHRSLTIREWLLGPSFLHGTWVGYVYDADGEVEYVLEHFEQDLESLRIRGRTYTQTDEDHALWRSDSVNIDVPAGTLAYSYLCELRTSSVTHQGVASFQLDRQDKHRAATGIAGFIADLTDGTRLPVREFKVSNKLLPWEEALPIAKNRLEHVKISGGKA